MALSEKSRNTIYRSLHTQLGEEATQEMLSYFPARDVEEPATKSDIAVLRGEITLVRRELDVVSAQIRAELHQEVGGLRAELHREIGGLRAEMHEEIGGLRAEMHEEIGGLRAEMHEEIGGLRAELHEEIGGLRAEMNRRFDDQKTWMVGTMLALSALMFTATRIFG